MMIVFGKGMSARCFAWNDTVLIGRSYLVSDTRGGR
jgi:hypothetical protein